MRCNKEKCVGNIFIFIFIILVCDSVVSGTDGIIIFGKYQTKIDDIEHKIKERREEVSFIVNLVKKSREASMKLTRLSVSFEETVIATQEVRASCKVMKLQYQQNNGSDFITQEQGEFLKQCYRDIADASIDQMDVEMFFNTLENKVTALRKQADDSAVRAEQLDKVIKRLSILKEFYLTMGD